MRIGLICHTNAPWTPYYARYLSERGHDVHVLSFHPKPLGHGQVHYFCPMTDPGELPVKYAYLARMLGVRKLLRQLRPDVVLAAYVRSNGLIGALTKCSPLIVSSRGLDWDFPLPGPLKRKLIRWIAGRAELLHASSQEQVDQFAAMGVERERFTVIPLGTEPSVFIPREGDRPAGPPRLICTRKHHPLYDNLTIVRALGILRDTGFHFQFRFVGSGTALEQTKDLVRELNLSEQVEFFGNVEHHELPAHLQWADVYVSAATSDGSPSSLFEAMSCGFFPVVTDVIANRYWIRHRENGCLFAVGDARACADGLRFAWENRELAARAGRENRQTVLDKLDRNAGLARLERLLERAVEIGKQG